MFAAVTMFCDVSFLKFSVELCMLSPELEKGSGNTRMDHSHFQSLWSCFKIISLLISCKGGRRGGGVRGVRTPPPPPNLYMNIINVY